MSNDSHTQTHTHGHTNTVTGTHRQWDNLTSAPNFMAATVCLSNRARAIIIEQPCCCCCSCYQQQQQQRQQSALANLHMAWMGKYVLYILCVYWKYIFINFIYLISILYRKWLQKKRKNFAPFGNSSCCFIFIFLFFFFCVGKIVHVVRSLVCGQVLRFLCICICVCMCMSVCVR